MLTIKNILASSIKQLSSTSESAQLDCELLLSTILNKPRSHLHAWPEKLLSDEEIKQFNLFFQQRLEGQPIAYILGERGFWNLNLIVTADTLIPRPDTERLVELALENIAHDAQWKILDLGTGTGAIGLSLAKEKLSCSITATDNSPAALMIAEKNAGKNHVTNIKFILSDWFSALENQTFHMIVTNPPYIKKDDPHLSEGDVRFEPLSALTSGTDGLDDIQTIVEHSVKHLTKNGLLLIEHGYEQTESVCTLFKKAGFTQIKNFNDSNDISRVVLGILSN